MVLRSSVYFCQAFIGLSRRRVQFFKDLRLRQLQDFAVWGLYWIDLLLRKVMKDFGGDMRIRIWIDYLLAWTVTVGLDVM